MLIFKAIKNLNSVIPFNVRLREIVNTINELSERLSALEGNQGESVAIEEEQVVSDPVDVSESVQTDEVDEQGADDSIDDSAIDSAVEEDRIRNQAKEAGIKSWHVKSVQNLKAELDALNKED